MVPIDKVRDIISRHNALEKELKTTKQKFKNSSNGRRRDAFDFE